MHCPAECDCELVLFCDAELVIKTKLGLQPSLESFTGSYVGIISLNHWFSPQMLRTFIMIVCSNPTFQSLFGYSEYWFHCALTQVPVNIRHKLAVQTNVL